MELRPDGLWSWVVCAASGLSILIVSGGAFNFGLLLPPLMNHFNTTRQATAWIGSMNLACGYVLAPFSVYLADRFGYRVTAIVGALSGFLGFFLASFSPTLWMMYPTYGLLSGFGHRTIYSTSNLVVLHHFAKWRSVAVGFVTSAVSVAVFAVTQFTQALLNAFGWRWAVRGFACLYIICALCSGVYLPVSESAQKSENRQDTAEKDNHQRRNATVLRNRSFLLFSASTTIILFSYYIPLVHIVKYCKQELQIPEDDSFMLFTYFAIASFISRHFFCKLGDFKCVNRFYVYQFTQTVNGINMLCLPLARSFRSLVAIFVVFGFMDGGLNGQQSLLLLKCVDKDQVNQAWGYLSFFTGFGVGIGPPLAGLMADELGSYTAAFYTAGSIIIAGASIVSLLKFTKQPTTEDSVEQAFKENETELLVVETMTVL